MAKVLVTGAAGFVGVAVCKALRARGDEVIAAVRSGAQAGQMNVGDIGPDTDWSTALQGCDAVIHLAARVHVMADREQDPMRAYRSVNVDATLNLAAQAMRHGVRRFVFVSSVKVNGEATTDRPFSAADVPMPCDPYGQSKLEAERGLAALAATGCLEVAIVRPPLVYGPGVKANFLNLMRLVERGLPLPFGRVRNARSMVALDNLVDLLIVCTHHARAPGGTFMVSDGADLGIAELAKMIATAMGKTALLLPVPPAWMRLGAALLGKRAVADRLLDSLQVDIGATQATLDWYPLVSQQAAIAESVAYFKAFDRSGKK